MTVFLPVKVKKQRQSPSNATQARFNTLQKEIETLRKDLENKVKRLNDCLNFYANNIYPQKNQLQDILKKQIKLLYSHYSKKKAFSKKEKACLKRFMLNRIDRIFDLGFLDDSDKELIDIYENLNNLCHKTVLSEEFEAFKDNMKEQFAEEGLDVDLSDLRIEDGEDGFLHRLFESIEQKQQNHQKKEIPPRIKSKNQLERESQEALQKKEIGVIYKQLVKIIHPDLEQDPAQKPEKEELMKKLSFAYKNNDLYTILSLEMDWLKQSNNPPKIDSNERFKTYNKVLQKQASDLRNAISEAPFQHQYFHLQNYFTSKPSVNMSLMKKELSKLQMDLKSNKELVHELESENAANAIYELIHFMRH